MSVSDQVNRFRTYYGRHGFGAALKRACVHLMRSVFPGRMVVFYCDLDPEQLPAPIVPPSIHLQRVCVESGLPAADVERMTALWDPDAGKRRIRERFKKGASLWLLRSSLNGEIAGYGWSLKGATVEPYFFPLASTDVHLFDFHVYEEYRGQGLNPLLVGHILSSVAKETAGRAFIECAEWNQSQRASLKKTPFRHLGLVKTTACFRRVFSCWTEDPIVQISNRHRNGQATDASA